MPKRSTNPPPTTRIVDPETEHVHAPITRMDGKPAWVAKPDPTDVLDSGKTGDPSLKGVARKNSRKNKRS